MSDTHTPKHPERKLGLEADVYPLISIMFLCLSSAEKTRGVCKTKGKKPQVPVRPLQLENTQQQSTCVSKLILTGLSGGEKKVLLLLRRTRRIHSDVSGIYAEWIGSFLVFPSFIFREPVHLHESSLGKKINLLVTSRHPHKARMKSCVAAAGVLCREWVGGAAACGGPQAMQGFVHNW